MNKKHLFALSAMACIFAACQRNSYKIAGTTDGLNDGDTLFLTQDLNTGIPSDTLIVKDGRFETEKKSDSIMLTLLYAPKDPSMSALFFSEPGTINIKLSQTPNQTTIGGTKVNDALQELNSLAGEFGNKMQEIAAVFYDSTATEESKKQALEQERNLQNELTKNVIEVAEKNIDNELGFFIITSFGDEEAFSSEKRKELINKMPANFRSRNEVKELLQIIEASEATAVGKAITDFTLQTPEGEPLSAMSEIAKNKVTILDFWASWCGPCRQETPFMVELFKEFHEKGLGIVGISLDEDKDAWVKAIGELHMSWPQMSDLKGWQSEAGQLFQVTSIPFMVVVDQNGKILQKGLRGDDLKSFISNQLK